MNQNNQNQVYKEQKKKIVVINRIGKLCIPEGVNDFTIIYDSRFVAIGKTVASIFYFKDKDNFYTLVIAKIDDEIVPFLLLAKQDNKLRFFYYKDRFNPIEISKENAEILLEQILLKDRGVYIES